MSKTTCILCNSVTQPQKRVILKKNEEPFSSLQQLLTKTYSEDLVLKYLKEPVISCRGSCHTMLRNLSKKKLELCALENEVVEKLGVRLDCMEVVAAEEPSTPTGRRRVHHSSSVNQSMPRTLSFGTPGVSVLCTKGDKRRVYHVPRSLRSLGRAVGRKRKKSIVNLVMKDKQMRTDAIVKVGKLVQKELTYTCSQDAKSMYANKCLEDLQSFQWSMLANDLKRTMPTMSKILEMSVKATDNKKDIVTAFIGGILLKQHNERMTYLQRLFSLILYSSHSPKQLYKRLQTVGVSMSHKSTIRYVDILGSNYDEPVKQWTRNISDMIWKNEMIAPTIDETFVTDGQEDSCSSQESQGSDSIMSTISGFLEVPVTPPSPSDSSSLSSVSVASESKSIQTVPEEIIVPSLPLDNPSPTIDLPSFPTFKIVGDNIDKSVKPRQETSEHHTKSLHYFHSYAVRDRTDVSGLSDEAQLPDLESNDAAEVLPSADDLNTLRHNMTIIAGRIIRNHCQFFRDNINPITRHIKHQFSKQMAKKSEVIPLGVQLKNEIKNEDMIAIMSHLQQYVPVKSQEGEVIDPSDGEAIKVIVDEFHYILFGGDQLTAERSTGAQRSMSNENRGYDRLEGLIPVIEDWHAKVCLLKSIWRILYNTSSGINPGTLFQLRNLIKRRAVTKEIKSDPTVCEEFFLLIVTAHVLHLFMKRFHLDTLDDSPPTDGTFGVNFLEYDKAKRTETFIAAVGEIIVEYTHGFEIGKFEGNVKNSDGVLAYAKELLTLGLLYMEFNDGIHEADGLRILRCWRYMLLIFKSTGKRKYSVQAATLLFQYEYIFTERMKHQLLWNRTVNVHGKTGKNIAMDLHMEHLNRELKGSISYLGANVAASTIQRVGYCLRPLMEIKHNFDKSSGISIESGRHTSRSLTSDLKLVLDQLKEAEVFDNKPKRKHSEFKSFKCNIAGGLKMKDLEIWLNSHLNKLINL